jgi:hypothetical protein
MLFDLMMVAIYQISIPFKQQLLQRILVPYETHTTYRSHPQISPAESVRQSGATGEGSQPKAKNTSPRHRNTQHMKQPHPRATQRPRPLTSQTQQYLKSQAEHSSPSEAGNSFRSRPWTDRKLSLALHGSKVGQGTKVLYAHKVTWLRTRRSQVLVGRMVSQRLSKPSRHLASSLVLLLE